MISLLTWRWTDGVCKFSYATFDEALYRYPSRQIHEFTSLCSKFIEVYVCQNLFQCKTLWQSYYKNKRVQFLGHSVYIVLRRMFSSSTTRRIKMFLWWWWRWWRCCLFYDKYNIIIWVRLRCLSYSVISETWTYNNVALCRSRPHCCRLQFLPCELC